MADLTAADLGAPTNNASAPIAQNDLGAPSTVAPSSPITSKNDLGDPSSNLDTSTPQTIPTPHQYDSVIHAAAKKYGIDENVLRSVGIQESGLGRGSGYDPKTGLDTTGNKGHGLFQLDPSSGASQDDLNRAAKDPAFAADYAARMLKRNLDVTHGDMRAALSMYNADIGDSPNGLTYADQVLRRARHIDSPNYISTFIHDRKNDARIIHNQLKKGKTLGQALAKTPTFRPLAQIEANGKVNWEWAAQHPVTSVANLLNTEQRAVGGFEYSASHGATLKGALRSAWDMALNPTPVNVARSTYGAGAVINSLSKKMKGPQVFFTDEEIDRNTQALYSHALHQFPALKFLGATEPYVAGGQKFTEDLIQQNLESPGALGTLLTAGSAAAFAGTRGILQGAMALAQSHGITQHLPHLQQLHNLSERIQDIFTARRDLDKAGFTKKGKNVRMAVENAALARRTRSEGLDQEALSSANAGHNVARRYLQQVYEHGSRSASNAAARLLGVAQHASPTGHLIAGNIRNTINHIRTGTAEEREHLLRSVRRSISEHEVHQATENLVRQDPTLFNGHIGALRGVGFKDTSELIDALRVVARNNTWFAKKAKQGVMLNPIPHGIKNVGIMSYMAGGMNSVFHGLASMAHGVDPATLHRLEAMGAMPLYIDHATSKWGKGANAMLERMEQGWRAGLLRHLDDRLGHSAPGSVQEMLKGQMISQLIGDYRNQNAFVHMLRALGGEFVAFRLGIAPANAARALVKHPERVVRLERAREDVQTARTRRGQQLNELNLGGPDSDIAELALNPTGFLTSPSTIGGASAIKSQAPYKSHAGAVDTIMHIAGLALPPLGMASHIAQSALGLIMPGQNMSWADRVMSIVTQTTSGGYYRRLPTPRQSRTEAKKTRKAQGL